MLETELSEDSRLIWCQRDLQGDPTITLEESLSLDSRFYTARKHGDLTPEWLDKAKFKRDIGPIPKVVGISLIRIDTRLPFGPDNTRWGTVKDWTLNRQGNLLFVIDGVKMSGRTLCKEFDLNKRMLVIFDTSPTRVFSSEEIRAFKTKFARPVYRRLMFKWEGKDRTLGELVKLSPHNVTYQTLWQRLFVTGQSLEKAMHTPPRNKRGSKRGKGHNAKYVYKGEMMSLDDIAALYKMDADKLNALLIYHELPLEEILENLEHYSKEALRRRRVRNYVPLDQTCQS